MCDPVTVGLVIGGLSASSAVYSATQTPSVKPTQQPQQQQAKTPGADAYRSRAAQAPKPRASASSGSLLTSAGSNLAGTTLLGQ